MKCQALLLAASLYATGQAAKLVTSPVAKVVNLLTELRAQTDADGKKEQQSYDKFACWCEETMSRKAADISREKDTIDRLQTVMTKLQGDLGAHTADIEQLKKDIAANLDSQREATEVREKENAAYEGEKTEYEQSIGALEAAIKVLTGAGAGKKGGFLETMQQAKLLSAAADVQRVMHSKLGTQWSNGQDLEVVKRFLARPEDFVGRDGFMGAQTGQNPFGDYAPQSTQIQGILKSMYDSFTSDLEKVNARESESQKSFEELMATKKKEASTLEATLLRQEADMASKKKLYEDSKQARDNNAAMLEADEKLFADSKAACKKKASEWAERSRVRTEELAGFNKAIAILSSEEAQATFARATSLVQLKARRDLGLRETQTEGADMAARRVRAYTALRDAAAKTQDLGLAQIAAEVKTEGHFDKVMAMIDHMVELIRKEERDDFAHRDRCQASEGQNQGNIEDLQHLLEKTEEEMRRIEDKIGQSRAKVNQLESDIAATKGDMAKRLEMRNKERSEFEQALKDDTTAVGLLQAAIQTLRGFYEKNNIPMELVQKREDPEHQYTVDPNKAPETWAAGGYHGQQEQHTNIVGLLEMIVEDLQKEMETSRKEEQESERLYEEAAKSLAESLKAQEDSKVVAEQELAAWQSTLVEKQGFHTEKQDDLNAEHEYTETLRRDCAWVKTHFDSRNERRKAELDGLAEAKSILAGVDAGDYNELVLSMGR